LTRPRKLWLSQSGAESSMTASAWYFGLALKAGPRSQVGLCYFAICPIHWQIEVSGISPLMTRMMVATATTEKVMRKTAIPQAQKTTASMRLTLSALRAMPSREL
jgi:hypothetical protein